MSSSNKTSYIHLNQWSGSDKPKREDFNSDNFLLDEKIEEVDAGIQSLMDLVDDKISQKSLPFSQSAWTPVINVGTYTIADQNCVYTRIYNKVFLDCVMSADFGSSSDMIQVSGLPLRARGHSYGAMDVLRSTTVRDIVPVINGTQYIQFHAANISNGGRIAGINATHLLAGDHFVRFSIWYTTDL